MSPLTVGQALENFFSARRRSLERHYPGLRLEHLKRSLQETISLEQYYAPAIHAEVDEFFHGLEQGRPLAYGKKRKAFFRHEFAVGPGVLIPRPETELLVEKAVSFLQQHSQAKRVVDVGTGSGCLLLSILAEISRPLWAVGIDCSGEALRYAHINGEQKKYARSSGHEIHWRMGDRLAALDGQVDVIVSNPPYIKEQAGGGDVHPQVRHFEPYQALFLADDFYERWYREFFHQALEKLTPQGIFLLEGHEQQLKNLQEMALQTGWAEVRMSSDLSQRDRFLEMRKVCG